MKFEEALPSLKAGKKISLPEGWRHYKEKLIFFMEDGQVWSYWEDDDPKDSGLAPDLTFEEILRDDWYVLKE